MPAADLLDIALAGLGGLFALMALAGCAVALLTRAAVARYGGRADAPALPAYPSVTVLKPLHGDEPGLAENLGTVLRQDYPGFVEVVFGVQRRDDPALVIARALASTASDTPVRIVVDERRHGRNGKVSNLINMAPAIRGDVVVLADSDMRVGPDYLRRVVEALAAPGVGLVTCLYRGAALPGLPSRLIAAGIDLHFLPGVLLGLVTGLAKPCFGSTIALRRDTLERIGGFPAFADILADDNRIGQAVRGLGLKVAVPPRPVLEHLCTQGSFAEAFRQDLRWARTVRAVDPAGYAGSVVTNPLPLAAIAWLFGGFSLWGAVPVGLALVCRAALQQKITEFSGSAARPFWLGPLRDCWSFAVFVASYWPGSLDWRGHSFALAADGTMAPPEKTGS